MRQSPERVARLAALDDPEILYGLASRMIRDRPRFTWYLEPACDRLPAAELRRLAGEAVQAREDGANDAADDVIAYVSLHQPEALTAHLRSLWEVRPNARSYYASWPWRAADDAEVARLLEVARDPAGPDAQFAAGCLLQTRRPDVLAWLPADRHGLAHVGYGRDDAGALTRLHPAAMWHVAYPGPVLEQWAARNPLRVRQSSWPQYSGAGSRHVVSGFTGLGCPECDQPLHRLLRLDPVPAGLGITSRERVEFTWCPGCTPYARSWHARHAPDGTPADFTVSLVIVPEETDPEDSRAEWFIPESAVELVPLDKRWTQQDWALSNGRENLHRVGGEPTWIQNADYGDCPGCGRTMPAVAQIAVEDLWDAEGICYLLWCDPCAISAVVYQQT